jgi:hypothetical protein
MMYIQIAFLGVGVLIGIAIWGYAYRLGLRHGRAMSVPFRLIDELLDHKIHCCGQEPSTARLELETLLGLESWESQPLLQNVVQAARQPQNEKANVDLLAPPQSKKVA